MPTSAVELRGVSIAASGCLTALGDERETTARLREGACALRPHTVLGAVGGDPVPLALLPGRGLDETSPPSWFPAVEALARRIPRGDWGTPRFPVVVTSSNFGVGNLLAYQTGGDAAHLRFGSPAGCVGWLREGLGWGPRVTIFSHACVSAHLGLLHASRLVLEDMADAALVFSFDFLSPFVAGGFHALKILNDAFPAPYSDRPTGSIGLGDGAAFTVITGAGAAERGEFGISAQSLYNELSHFTANRADGSGFAACFGPVAEAVAQAGGRAWCKGHGTGTLEAGRLEAAACEMFFPGAPLVGWKGSLGHTLGSCGLVELALVLEAMRTGHAPGTVGAVGGLFSPHVAREPFATVGYDSVVCASNAFGGAHAALWVRRA